MAAIDIDGGVPATTLNGAITSGATSFTVADGAAYPDGTNGNFYVVIGLGTASEEVIECSARSVNTLTAATRGADGTSAAAHDNGASVQHVVPAVALQEANIHANQTTGTPHGSAYVTPSGNVATATALENERTIILSGDVSGTSSLFDGTANATITTTLANPISVDTSGNAATASALESPVTIGGISFDGSGSINLPGVNTAGNQNTSGSAAKWTTARTLTVNGDMTGNVSIDGSKNVTLTLSADLEAADIPNLSASKITTDTLHVDRIPNLNADKITTGTIDIDHIPDIGAYKIDAGTFGSGNYTFQGNLSINGDVIAKSELTVGQSTANTARKLYVNGGSLGSEIYRNSNSASEGILLLGGGSGSKFIFYADGSAAKLSGAGDWAGISDDRLKTKGDSIDPDETLAAMMTLDPTWHQYHTDANFSGELDENGFEEIELVERDEPTAPSMGFMASDLEAAFPNLVTYRGAQQIRLVPTGQYDALLTASIIALGNKVQELSARLEALEG